MGGLPGAVILCPFRTGYQPTPKDVAVLVFHA
jgi:hypothetical protein